MKSLQHLKEVALLGTAKKSLDESLLAEEVQAVLKSQKFQDQEDRFLKALGLQYFYDKAGQIPPKFTGELPMTSIEEMQITAGSEMNKILKRILLIDGALKESLLGEYLDVLIQQSRLIPTQFIIPLLKYGKNCKLATQNKLYQVIGNKGQWIMKQFDHYSLKTSLKFQGDDIWQHGITKQRKEYFEHWRKKDIEKANQLLASSWSEESIREKLSFLTIIKQTINQTDQVFLEHILKKEFAYQANEKKLTKACRKIIVECLLCLPSSKLFKQTTKQLKQYVNKKKELELPKKEDKFWSATNMVSTYALEETNEDIGQFNSDQLYWLSFFVAHIPMKIWNELLSRNTKETLGHFLKDKKFQHKVSGDFVSNLLPSIHALALQHKDQELILQLLEQPNYILDYPLVKALNKANWEFYILANEYVFDYKLISSWQEKAGEWSLEFSKSWLKKILQLLKKSNMGALDYRVGIMAAMYFNSAALNLLLDINKNAAQSLRKYNFWKDYIFSPILEGAEIRSLLKQNIST